MDLRPAALAALTLTLVAPGAADRNRGFDVFRWTGEGPAPWEAP